MVDPYVQCLIGASGSTIDRHQSIYHFDVMSGFKISRPTLSLLSLIIPLLIEPVNGLYDTNELRKILAYCFKHADRAAQGENVVNDLVNSGLVNFTFHDWSCSKISETLKAELE